MSNIISKNIEVNEYEIIVLENTIEYYEGVLARLHEDAANDEITMEQHYMIVYNLAKIEGFVTHLKTILKKYEEA